MAKQWLLKLDRQDDDQGHVLIRLTSKDSYDLDLDLLATEGEEVYKGKLRREDLQSLRAKTYNGTEGEWEAILRFALLEGKSSAISQEQKQSLEVGASRKDQKGKSVLSITFRNRVDDITQRIGAIELVQTSKTIQLFDWASLSADRNKILESEFYALSASIDGDKATIARLESQLADLVEAKADHEEQMLSKFVILLNEKKAKIRDQQRILQTAIVDKDRVRQLEALTSAGQSRDATRRTGKRPAPGDNSEEDESQAFGTQQDRRHDSQDEEEDMNSDRQTTPSSTESEANDDEDELPTQAKKISPGKIPPNSTKKPVPSPSTISHTRALPFPPKIGDNTKTETQPKVPKPPSIDDDEETASEDDEL